ncbi:hypothetical protein M5K25_001881 [Dendrobium thyrsiflorum]|uniref:Uncharacterized protein n=1 Tax=Dendrobium thyrsiflorum TaxID=117978 RepID=A0ABD0VSY7_DENTH
MACNRAVHSMVNEGMSTKCDCYGFPEFRDSGTALHKLISTKQLLIPEEMSFKPKMAVVIRPTIFEDLKMGSLSVQVSYLLIPNVKMASGEKPPCKSIIYIFSRRKKLTTGSTGPKPTDQRQSRPNL